MKKTCIGLLFLISTIFYGYGNDSTSDFQQTPPPYPPSYGYILSPVYAQNMILRPYGQANLDNNVLLLV